MYLYLVYHCNDKVSLRTEIITATEDRVHWHHVIS